MVRTLPIGQSLFIRTDFSDKEAWEILQADTEAVRRNADGIAVRAGLTIVDDHTFDALSIGELLELADGAVDYAFVADSQTFENPRRPILVVDLSGDREDDDTSILTFRVTPELLASVESNLSLANLDFADYIDNIDGDGVFTGGPARAETRTLSRQDLLDAAPQSKLPSALVSRYIEALEHYRPLTLSAKFVPDLRDLYEYLVSNSDGWNLAEEILGRQESMEVASKGGGPTLVFNFPIRRGWWSAYVDPKTLVPVTLLMSRARARKQRES